MYELRCLISVNGMNPPRFSFVDRISCGNLRTSLSNFDMSVCLRFQFYEILRRLLQYFIY
jgi:hypothetical protein